MGHKIRIQTSSPCADSPQSAATASSTPIVESEIDLLRKEIASLKRQLAATISNASDDNDGGFEFPGADFLDDDVMSSYDSKSNADASGTLHNQTAAKSSHQAETATDSLAVAATFSQAIKATAASTPPAASAAAAKNQNKMEGSDNSSVAAELNASHLASVVAASSRSQCGRCQKSKQDGRVGYFFRRCRIECIPSRFCRCESFHF